MTAIRKRIETLSSWLAFPVILAASPVATRALMDTGFAPFAAFVGPVVVSMGFVAPLAKRGPLGSPVRGSKIKRQSAPSLGRP